MKRYNMIHKLRGVRWVLAEDGEWVRYEDVTFRTAMFKVLERFGVEPGRVYRMEIDADPGKAKVTLHCYALKDGKKYVDGDSIAKDETKELWVELDFPQRID